MALDKQEFEGGERLVARFKKQEHRCEVVKTEEGIRFQVDGGESYKSISSAAKAITGGAINGWAFWSLEGTLKERKPRAPKPETAEVATEPSTRMVTVVVRCTKQEEVPEGQVKWYCKACADSFTVPASITPQGCPKGHAAEAPNGELVTVEPEQPVEAPAEPVEAEASTD